MHIANAYRYPLTLGWCARYARHVGARAGSLRPYRSTCRMQPGLERYAFRSCQASSPGPGSTWDKRFFAGALGGRYSRTSLRGTRCLSHCLRVEVIVLCLVTARLLRDHAVQNLVACCGDDGVAVVQFTDAAHNDDAAEIAHLVLDYRVDEPIDAGMGSSVVSANRRGTARTASAHAHAVAHGSRAPGDGLARNLDQLGVVGERFDRGEHEFKPAVA